MECGSLLRFLPGEACLARIVQSAQMQHAKQASRRKSGGKPPHSTDFAVRAIPYAHDYPECRNKITSPSCTMYSLPSSFTCAFSRAAAKLPALTRFSQFTTSALMNPRSMSL